MTAFSRRFAGLAAAALVAGMGIFASDARAATVNCPGTAAPTDREFTLTTTPGSTCLAFGPGNLNGNGDAINALGYLTLDKSDDGSTGLLPNALSGGLTSGLSGSFSFVAPGFTSFVIAFKSGVAQLNPDWAAFVLPAGVSSGSWAISGRQALSHVNLYGIKGNTPPAPIPVPTAGFLLLGGLGSFGLLARRRRKI